MYIVITLIIIIIFLSLLNFKETYMTENKLCVIVTTYNPGLDYLTKCLDSILNQTYKNYSLCIVNDASNINIEELKDLIKNYCEKHNWEYVNRDVNIGPLGSRIDAINKLNPEDENIIVSIDGDDELSNKYVFENLNKVYQDDTLITFGNYVNVNENGLSKPKIKCKKHNFKKIIRENSFRNYRWIFTHLKTFKFKLYKHINHDNLKKDNQYLKSATDLALMYPMLEMANNRFKCIENVLYKYNRFHPESNNISKQKLKLQKDNAKYVKSLMKYERKDNF